MDRETVRLECLKLVSRVDEPQELAIAKAKILENYILESETEKAIVVPKDVKHSPVRIKTSDNPSTLS